MAQVFQATDSSGSGPGPQTTPPTLERAVIPIGVHHRGTGIQGNSVILGDVGVYSTSYITKKGGRYERPQLQNFQQKKRKNTKNTLPIHAGGKESTMVVCMHDDPSLLVTKGNPVHRRGRGHYLGYQNRELMGAYYVCMCVLTGVFLSFFFFSIHSIPFHSVPLF